MNVRGVQLKFCKHDFKEPPKACSHVITTHLPLYLCLFQSCVCKLIIHSFQSSNCSQEIPVEGIVVFQYLNRSQRICTRNEFLDSMTY
ncbi:hypothetical protein R6Q59_031029 [Mikania micrantha]